MIKWDNTLSLIIHAPNIHRGGGRTLLVPLLSALDQHAILILDKRLDSLPNLSLSNQVFRVAPQLFARINAEFRLRALVRPMDRVLCFGNLPPLLPNSGRNFVYLQNRYLCSPCSLAGLTLPVRMRIRFERIWLRTCLRDAILLVQTETMRREVAMHLGRDAKVLPFLPKMRQDFDLLTPQKGNDYLYVASGESHKNHCRLIEAWVLLANLGFRPSLCLTLDPRRDVKLWEWIQDMTAKHELHVVNQSLSSDQMPKLYSQCSALIYPSLFESFGLPLLEAQSFGLPILAAERDYVRDVAVPLFSFDPESPLSIARAVMRHRGWNTDVSVPCNPKEFLKQLVNME